jgi:hypothetical protein
LLKEIVNNNPTIAQTAARPIEILGQILFAVADRANELNDEELNSLMCRLTLYTQADPQSKDYDKRTSRLIHKYDKKLIARLTRK